MTARKAFFDHDNKPSQSSIRKGVWILRSLTSLVHTPADANDHTAVGSVPPSFSNRAAPLRDHSEHAVCASNRDWTLPEENVNFGETFPLFSAFWTLCFLRRNPP